MVQFFGLTVQHTYCTWHMLHYSLHSLDGCLPLALWQTTAVLSKTTTYNETKCTAFNMAVSQTHLGVLHSRFCHQSHSALQCTHTYVYSGPTKQTVWKFV